MNKTHDEIIDQVLTGIRDVAPSAGLNRRILQAVETRASKPSPWTFSLSLRPWAYAGAATFAALLISIAYISTHRSSTATAQYQTTPVQHQDHPASSSNILSANSAPYTSLGRRPRLAPPSDRGLKARPIPATTLSAADRQALDDTLAPSHPAPPLPLSRDERILLAAAQRGRTIELAQLEPPPTRDPALQHIVQRFLHQLAAAETINPTPPEDAPQPLINPTPPEDAPQPLIDPNAQTAADTNP